MQNEDRRRPATAPVTLSATAAALPTVRVLLCYRESAMKTTMTVMLVLLFACSVIAMAGGDQNQNQYGKEDGEPGNGEQVKERERPDEPAGPDCPDDCPGCPDCDGPNGPGVCEQVSPGTEATPLATRDRDRDRDGNCEDPVGNGEGGGPNGDGDGNGPHGDGDGEGGDGPFGPGDCPEQD